MLDWCLSPMPAHPKKEQDPSFLVAIAPIILLLLIDSEVVLIGC